MVAVFLLFGTRGFRVTLLPTQGDRENSTLGVAQGRFDLHGHIAFVDQKQRALFFGADETLTEVDDEGSEIVDNASLRLSVGFGVTYVSPFGPILVDFAFPVLKEDFDETETIRFSFGTRF